MYGSSTANMVRGNIANVNEAVRGRDANAWGAVVNMLVMVKKRTATTKSTSRKRSLDHYHHGMGHGGAVHDVLLSTS